MTSFFTSQRTPVHRTDDAPSGHAHAAQRWLPGPIAVAPHPEPDVVRAVVQSGGAVSDLSEKTRGLVWLDYLQPERLAVTLENHPGLGWVQLPWAGVDLFATTIRDNPHVLWTSGKGAYAQPVAEHALALTLSLLRLIPQRVMATSWPETREGTSLYGLTVVVVGAGGVAREYIRMLELFGCRVIVVRRSSSPLPGVERTVTAGHLLDVLPSADVVMLAAALTGESTQLMGRDELRAMKSTAYLVNIARGGLVDQAALIDALYAGWIAGAGLDVTDPEPLPDGHPLWTTPNVIITPHSADTPEMIAPLFAERLSHNVQAFLGNGPFAGVIDPAVGY